MDDGMQVSERPYHTDLSYANRVKRDREWEWENSTDLRPTALLM